MSKIPQESNPDRDVEGGAMTDSTQDVTKLTDTRGVLANALTVSRRPGGTVSIDSAPIDWNTVAWTVGGCWMIFGLTGFLGSAVHVAPVALLIATVLCMVLDVNPGPGHELEIIFVYWTLVGVWLSWRMHKTDRPAIDVISRGLILHLVVNIVAWFPTAIIFFGR